MTPKEKATELVDKFKQATSYKYQEYAGANYSVFEHDIDTLKQCALIAVDEILIAIRNDQSDDPEGQEMYENYWNEVKTEINAL